MTHAFLSYVSEDAGSVDYVESLLRANGVRVWRDKSDLTPGLGWRRQLQMAVQNGSFFVPFFSPAWAAKNRTVANEEVQWAIHELALRPQDRAWFLPFLLPGGSVPVFEISPGRYISDLQHISVDASGWTDATTSLLKALDVDKPDLLAGDPLGPNLPSSLALVNGQSWIDEVQPDLPVIRGMIFPFTEGAVWRDQGGLIAQLRALPPNKDLEQINRSLGLNVITCRSPDVELSCDASRPSVFASSRVVELRKGYVIPAMLGTPAVTMPADMRVEIEWTATAWVDGKTVRGSYEGTSRWPTVTFSIRGRFEIEWQPRVGPIPTE